MPNKNQKVHFIAIGGSIMHNLAIALKNQGMEVSGSDDKVYDPAKSYLEKHGLLPSAIGWDSERIHKGIDAVILGMHAKADNPELQRAQELGLKIYSFPEYVFEQSQNKQRIVIAGSHGKTTIAGMIIHVLRELDRDFDYLVGAHIEGFDTMVKLSDAPVIIIEGDEYLTSSLDSAPKFLKYHHHIGLVSGIAWDHYNVFPNEKGYINQFEMFADATPKAGSLVYFEGDKKALEVCGKERGDVVRLPYDTHVHKIKDGISYLIADDREIPIKVFGNHNLQNISGAREILRKIGITDKQFYQAIGSFEGAAKRLELLNQNGQTSVYQDFAHAPSKVKATVEALKGRYNGRQLVACLELHTFSSLNKAFISQYAGTMNGADEGIVFFKPGNVTSKGLDELTEGDIREAFGQSSLKVFTNKDSLENYLKEQSWQDKNLLLMSSGKFNGMDLNELCKKVLA